MTKNKNSKLKKKKYKTPWYEYQLCFIFFFFNEINIFFSSVCVCGIQINLLDYSECIIVLNIFYLYVILASTKYGKKDIEGFRLMTEIMKFEFFKDFNPWIFFFQISRILFVITNDSLVKNPQKLLNLNVFDTIIYFHLSYNVRVVQHFGHTSRHSRKIFQIWWKMYN